MTLGSSIVFGLPFILVPCPIFNQKDNRNIMQSELIGKQFPILDQGWVELRDVMGTDQSIVEAARVCYGTGTTKVSDNRGLIRYLMRHRHTTPFEMCELKFVVQVPMDCWRQWIRHRTANVNEYSTRYSEAIDEMQETQPDEWRLQNPSNKQGSSGFVEEWPKEDGYPIQVFEDKEDPRCVDVSPGEFLTIQEDEHHRECKRLYLERLKFGVAREQARKDLPLSNYTRAYWKIDLHNLFHFLGLRMDSHAQKEIRDYANVIGGIVKELFPLAWEAFSDYRLNAMFLSALDIEVLRSFIGDGSIDGEYWLKEEEYLDKQITNKRERAECRTKLIRLRILNKSKDE